MKKIGLHIILKFLVLMGTSMAYAQTHGMFIFGDNATYASHLPMFHPPHDYQVILQIELADLPHGPRMPSYDTLNTYKTLKAAGKDFFTIAPEPFDLNKLISGQLTQFKANLYDGHFEKGGAYIGPIQVMVSKIIHAAQLPHEISPITQDYLVFGKEGEYYSTHLITSKPSFDIIMKVSKPMHSYYVKKSKVPCNRRSCDEWSIYEELPDSSLPMAMSLHKPLKCHMVDKLGNPPPFYCDLPPSAGYSLVKSVDEMDAITSISTTIEKVLYLEEGELSH